uniref:EF-hand domain-containing protein n=1 Tax=Eutreptiella gymnastica TaxID=73025 RepID=A0A7S1IF65_9EUGL|mmetsp:Transcript_152455/g.266122  ORF Transcript_152455/g.266122 Transcript_152455/m.266122 type:complete len:194 (+) Transcript_152455:45-626(+)
MPGKKNKGKAKEGGDNSAQDLINQIEELAYVPPDRQANQIKSWQNSIKDTFSIFERDKSGTCDVREVGTIVRSLGMNPTEAQIVQMLEEIEEPTPTGYIQYEKLEALMMKILVSGEYNGACMARDGEEAILQAFEVLDPEGKGHIDAEVMKELMTGYGEKLSAEEVNEFLNAASDPETGYIRYEDYAILLSTE